MNGWLRRLSHEMKTEKRKLGTLVALVLVAVLLWGKLLIPAGTQRASGQDPLAMQGDVGGGEGEAEREPIPQMPEPEVVQVEVRERVVRDPFRLRRDRYKAVEPQTPDPVAERREERLRHRRAVLAEADELTLQSTLIGQQPKAIINGRPVAPGQTINGFRVLTVEPRAVQLVKQDIRVTLRIRSD